MSCERSITILDAGRGRRDPEPRGTVVGFET
jgi:hypothetical protein